MSVETHLRMARFLADPYAAYSQLRAHDPVHWNAGFKCWTVTRHSDIVRILSDPAASSARQEPPGLLRPGGVRAEAVRAAAGTVHERLARWLIRLDPPAHTRLRALLTSAMTRSTVVALTPGVRLKAQQLIEAARLHGGMDLISEFASPLVLHCIASLIGLPEADHPRFKGWSDDIGAFAQGEPDAPTVVRAERSLQEVTSYLDESIRQRRDRAQPDLLTRLLVPRRDGDILSNDEIIDTSALLLLAGHETTAHAIANAASLIFKHPELRQLMTGDRDSVEQAIDEVLRFNTPLLGVLRQARNDLTVGEKRIERGHNILLWLAAGNHDETRFEKAGSFDPRRARNRHLAFGHGSHACIGARLARVTIEVATRTLLESAPRIQLASDASVWQGNALFRCLRALPVRL